MQRGHDDGADLDDEPCGHTVSGRNAEYPSAAQIGEGARDERLFMGHSLPALPSGSSAPVTTFHLKAIDEACQSWFPGRLAWLARTARHRGADAVVRRTGRLAGI